MLPPLAGDIVCPEWPVEDVEDNESHRKNVHENRVGFGQSAITTIMTCIDRDEGKTIHILEDLNRWLFLF